MVNSWLFERDVGLPGGSRLRRAWVSMSGEDSSSHTSQEIGQTLERARRERGLSLQQVEQATKIRVRYLRDLENENFGVLPPVYMLGSLKTYARYLGLDVEALAREFKRRQAFLQEEQSPPREEPQPGETRGFLASLGRLLGVGSLQRGEDEAGTVPDHGHSPRLYLSLGVVLIFILVTALASSLSSGDRPTVSQVNEPKTAQFPAMLVLVGNLEEGRNTAAVNEENQPANKAKPPAKDASKDEAERSGRDKETAQVSSSSATASASSASTGSTSASARSTPASVGPEPAATEEPEDEERAVADAATARPTAPSTPPARAPAGPGVQRRASPPDATLLGNRIQSKVRIAVHPTR